MAETYGQLHVETRAEWRKWLMANHETQRGVWLVTWKWKTGKPQVGYDDIVEEALCFGWIDSKSQTVDDERTRMLMTRRSPKSNWSRLNKQRIEKLVKAGLLAPAGEEMVRLAKKSGTWTALDGVENLVEPPDLASAFAEDPSARKHWDSFPRSTRRAILEWILTAKTEPTRTKRIVTTVSEAHEGRRANQWQPKEK